MLRFAFIIPLRSRAESIDWGSECKLLYQTIQSVLHQTYPGFKVFVVYTDLPENQVTDERVTYVLFPYGHQAYEDIANKEDLLLQFKKSIRMVVRRWDKARKLTYGSKLAKEEGYDYIMALDADDLLSNRFLTYLEKEARQKKCNGWYIHKGYLYKEKTNYLIRVPKLMHFLNGSTHMLSADLINIPDFNSTNWQDYNLFTDHGWIKDRLKDQQGVTIQAIPFAALVYVVHRSNISKVSKKEYGLSLKNMIKRIVRGVRLTKQLRKEFGLNDPTVLATLLVKPLFYHHVLQVFVNN